MKTLHLPVRPELVEGSTANDDTASWQARKAPLRVESPRNVLTGIILLFFVLLLVCLFGCQEVQKPELKGEGPLAVVVPRGSTAPEYHAPIERWRTLHMEAIHRGDFTQRECVLCHNPDTGCNRCHTYIGAKVVSVPEAVLYWPETKKGQK